MQNSSGGKTALGLDTNVGALLTYLPFCGISLIYSIIVIATDKTNKIVRFHAFQSLLLTVVSTIAIIAVALIGGILIAATESALLGTLLLLVYGVVLIGFIGLMLLGCYKAFQGADFRLPVIGDMADKWSN